MATGPVWSRTAHMEAVGGWRWQPRCHGVWHCLLTAGEPGSCEGFAVDRSNLKWNKY